MSTPSIFLSYRREDSASETRIIRDALQEAGNKVFMDTTSIGLGNWPKQIKDAIQDANIVIAIIGNKWLNSHDSEGRRRIDNEEDWVRRELHMALQTNKTVLPVLVNDAKMPSPESLPPDLREMANWQGVILTKVNWETDIQNLLNKIGKTQVHKNKPLILLTSESPRRKELLRQIGWEENIDYIAMNASVNLDVENNEKLTLNQAKKIAEKTAVRKIHWTMDRVSEIPKKIGQGWNPSSTIMVGVDTIVFCNNKILDRPLLQSLQFAGPKDIEEARKRAKEMLMEQRGHHIYVITSVALALATDANNVTVETFVTEADLRLYSKPDIDNYIRYAQPFDKAGAFGIQEKGISLFTKIKGNYTNIVGLPLKEFISLLQQKYGDAFQLPEIKSSLQALTKEEADLSVVCVGDINYDYIYDKFPVDFFSTLTAPGKKIIGSIHRSVGGTAVNFAIGASKAGFAPCYVVGGIGGDALEKEIIKELHYHDITPIYKPNPNEKTSIAIIFRNTAKKDTSITLTDRHQSLPDFVVDLARDTIEKSDVFYCSGYCLTDRNRYANALKMLKAAKDAQRLTVLDIVVGMSDEMSLDELTGSLYYKKLPNLVDVIVSELPEIFGWMHLDVTGKTELEVWDTNKLAISRLLKELFLVSILRTSDYTYEIVITPESIIGPVALDYSSVKASDKVGYGDFRTAKQVYSFLSPRIVLASKSPQRFNLLSQIVSPSKIEVVVSNIEETQRERETPQDRVKRLALAKANAVFADGQYHKDVELIIGADTEIIRESKNGKWEMIGHPKNPSEATRDLTNLNGKSHLAITGMAVIGRDPRTGNIKKVVDCVETVVTFENLQPEQIKAYVETGEPIGRAGAYAIQGLGAMLIKDLEGSYSNVVGLPLEKLCEILADKFHKPIWVFDKVSGWTFPSPIRTAEQ
jgi:septum formation protein